MSSNMIQRNIPGDYKLYFNHPCKEILWSVSLEIQKAKEKLLKEREEKYQAFHQSSELFEEIKIMIKKYLLNITIDEVRLN